MRVGVDEAVGEAGADGGGGEERGERGDEQVRELAEGAGGPGVDLEVGGQGGAGVGGEVGEAGGEGVNLGCGWLVGGQGRGRYLPVEGAGAVEEFEVEGGGGLAVDFSAGTGLHGHCWLLVEDEMLWRR